MQIGNQWCLAVVSVNERCSPVGRIFLDGIGEPFTVQIVEVELAQLVFLDLHTVRTPCIGTVSRSFLWIVVLHETDAATAYEVILSHDAFYGGLHLIGVA